MRKVTLERVVGRGAMGTLYAGTVADTNGTSRLRAVKVMKSAGTDRAGFRRRLAEQAHVLARSGVDGIVGVEEVVQLQGLDAVVGPLLEGVDLAEVRSAGALPAKACAELGAALAGRVAALHARGLVHRDLKPTNVLVSDDGEVWLLDFGVARAAYAEREDKTQGLVLGTLNYFPPEILAGGTPDQRVDLYGIGVLLLELASGREWGPPLVHRDRFERRVTQRLEALPENRAGLRDALQALLRWSPEDRPDATVARDRLVDVAGALDGPSLAEWASDSVPATIAVRRRPRGDELVGKTFDIDGGAEAPPVEPSRSPSAPAQGGNTLVWVAVAAFALVFVGGLVVTAVVIALAITIVLLG